MHLIKGALMLMRLPLPMDCVERLHRWSRIPEGEYLHHKQKDGLFPGLLQTPRFFCFAGKIWKNAESVSDATSSHNLLPGISKSHDGRVTMPWDMGRHGCTTPSGTSGANGAASMMRQGGSTCRNALASSPGDSTGGLLARGGLTRWSLSPQDTRTDSCTGDIPNAPEKPCGNVRDADNFLYFCKR